MISGTTVITMPTTIFFVSSQTSLSVSIFDFLPSGLWLASPLEREFRRQLNLSRDSLEGCRGPCGGSGSGGRASRNFRHQRRAGCLRTRSHGRGIVRLWSVKEIEELGAELHHLAFSDFKVLEDRKVNVLRARPLEDVASGISPRSVRQRASQRNADERGCVEPFLPRALIARKNSVAVTWNELGTRREPVAHSVG